MQYRQQSMWYVLVGVASHSLLLPCVVDAAHMQLCCCSWRQYLNIGVWVGFVALVELGCCVNYSGVQPLVVHVLFPCPPLACGYDVVLQWCSNSGVDTYCVWGWGCDDMSCCCDQCW